MVIVVTSIVFIAAVAVVILDVVNDVITVAVVLM